MIGGLLLLGISYRAFHKKSAERIDALQQLRAAKQGRTAAAAAAGGSGGFLGGRRSGVGLGSAAAEGVGQGGAVNEERRHVMPSNLSEEGAANQQGGGQSELQRYCEEHFGLEWVRRWGAAARQVCSASQQLLLDGAAGSAGSGSPSAVTCRSMTDPHMPAASAPHVLCDATNLRLDPAKLVSPRVGRRLNEQSGRANTTVQAEQHCSAFDSSLLRVLVSCVRPRPPRLLCSGARVARCTAPATSAAPRLTITTNGAPGPLTAPGQASACRHSAKTTSR